jgi:hypothetical protein
MSSKVEWNLKILCMGAGYVGGPTMAVIAKQCPNVCAIAMNQCERTRGICRRDFLLFV